MKRAWLKNEHITAPGDGHQCRPRAAARATIEVDDRLGMAAHNQESDRKREPSRAQGPAMHYRSAVLVVGGTARLTGRGASRMAQYTFVSTSRPPRSPAMLKQHAALQAQPSIRRQEERERIARERLALEERRVALQEQLIPAATPAPEPTPAAEPFQLVLVDREQLAAVVQYLHDVGLSRDQLSDVLDLLLETRER